MLLYSDTSLSGRKRSHCKDDDATLTPKKMMMTKEDEKMKQQLKSEKSEKSEKKKRKKEKDLKKKNMEGAVQNAVMVEHRSQMWSEAVNNPAQTHFVKVRLVTSSHLSY